jgi:hypothetical protein
MKYLLKFNESNSFLDLKEIIYSLEDICMDLKDEGFTINILPDNDIRLKMLSIVVSNTLRGLYKPGQDLGYVNGQPFAPDFTLSIVKFQLWQGDRENIGFVYNNSIKEYISRIEEYMKSNGFDSKVEPMLNGQPINRETSTFKVGRVLITFTMKDPA